MRLYLFFPLLFMHTRNNTRLVSHSLYFFFVFKFRTHTLPLWLCISSDWFISISVHFMNFWTNTRTVFVLYMLTLSLHLFVSFACVSPSPFPFFSIFLYLCVFEWVLDITHRLFACIIIQINEPMHNVPQIWIHMIQTIVREKAKVKKKTEEQKKTKNQHDKHRRFSEFFQEKK